MSTGTLVLIINVTLLIVGFCVFGRSFGIRTVYCSMLMSLSIYILERVLPMEHPLTTQPMLELVFSVLFPAVGSAILFNSQGSSGGTDIVAMIFKNSPAWISARRCSAPILSLQRWRAWLLALKPV